MKRNSPPAVRAPVSFPPELYHPLRTRKIRIAKSVATGTQGEFEFAGLAPGGYAIKVTKTGYRVAEGEHLHVRVPEQGRAPMLSVTLWPNGAISGRVLDTEGEPVPEAEVSVYRLKHSERGVSLPRAGQARSNDLGEYRVYGLPAGRYFARVWPPRPETPAGLYYAGTSGAFYPRVLQPSQALPLDVRWGDELNDIDLRLSDEPTHTLVASVWDGLEGRPCARCRLSAIQVDGDLRVRLRNSSRPSREGAFVFRGLPAGEYQLIAGRGTDRRFAARATVTVAGDSVIETVLSGGLAQDVSGKVVLVDPPEGVDASGWSSYLGPVRLPLSWPAGETDIDENLRFHIAELPPARYRLEIGGLPPGAYLKSVRLGGQTLPGPEIVVREYAPLTGLARKCPSRHVGRSRGDVRCLHGAINFVRNQRERGGPRNILL